MISVISWVLDHSEAAGGARLVLIVLAEHAHEDGGESFPSVDTIARRARMSRRGVQENLRRLEADGHIERDGVSRKGTTVWRVLMGGADSAPPQNPPGRTTTPEGGAPRAPEPPVEPSSGESSARASDGDPRNRLPEDFPEHLKPHARHVFRILRAVAEQHGAKRVWPQAVGKAIVAHPRHPLVEVAHELDVWAVDPPRPIRDVVATYRTFLGRRGELESAERLADDGTPTHAAPRPRAGVTPIRGRRARPQDWRSSAEAIMDVARRPRVAAELAGTVLQSEGFSAAAELVERVGLHEALGLARSEAAPPDGWAQAGAS